MAKTTGGPRVYRRVDVERVLRLKHLLYVEGLTLAGARRKLSEEQPDPAADHAALNEVAELLKLGVHRYFCKPIAMDELLATVEAALP